MSNYERVSGVIAVVGRNKKTLKLDGDETWYSAFKEQQLRGAQAGDEIEFDLEVKDVGGKTFYNIKGDVKVLGGSAPAQSRSTSRQASSAPAQPSRAPQQGVVTEADRQRSIQRQVALKAAVEYNVALLANTPDARCSIDDIIEDAERLASFLE